MNNNLVLIGFDFSINKPTMTVLYNSKYYHYFWPLKITKKNIKLYKEADVTLYNRDLTSISKNNIEDGSLLVLMHVIRSTELCNKIIEDLDNLLYNIIKVPDTCELYICSEGLSFGSKGDATLNLALYKGVLLNKIYEHYGEKIKKLLTYPPITIKVTANCADKESIKDKDKMILKYIELDNDIKLRHMLSEGKMKGKKHYIVGIDDIVDSYWAILTMIKKEELNV